MTVLELAFFWFAAKDLPLKQKRDLLDWLLAGEHLVAASVGPPPSPPRRAQVCLGIIMPLTLTREMWAAAGDAVVKMQAQGTTHHDSIVDAVWEALLAARPQQ